MKDCKHPYRIVVGTVDERAREVILADNRSQFLRWAPMRFTERRSLELIKYASNGFLATIIAFINEMTDLCEKTGANLHADTRGTGRVPGDRTRFCGCRE
jgi:UDPglucose 6-dehydrogenase